MIRCLRRLGAVLVVSALLIPLLPSARAAEPGKPAAWLVLRSYQRLEQRLRDLSTLAKTPGLADMLLGLVQLQLAGLAGVDRQRPVSVVIPTVTLSGPPPVILLVPYTEREGLLQTLRGMYPQLLVEDGDKFSLQGGAVPAFGRLDTQAKMLLVAASREALPGGTVPMPADLVGNQDEGPDLVLRVDMDVVKQQLDVVWKGMIASLQETWPKLMQKALDDQALALSPADKTAMMGWTTLVQNMLLRALDDLTIAESRLTLASTGWVWDFDAKMRAGSPSATVLNAQAGHTSRVGQLFAPHPDAFMRVVYNLRMTDDLRQAMTALSPAVRHMFEAKLGAIPNLTASQRTAGLKAIEAYMSLLDQWYAQKEVETAGEMRLQGTSFAMNIWVPFADSARAVRTALDLFEQVPLFTPQATTKVTRDVKTHQGTAVHRVDLPQLVPPQSGAPQMPAHLFLAAPGKMLVMSLGQTADTLQGLIDRVQSASSQPTTQTDVLAHVDIFVAPILKLGMNKGQGGKGDDPTMQAIITKLQGVNEPFSIDFLTRQSTATLRYALPGPLVQAFAEVVGQQITQQMQGGGAKKNEGGTKNNAAPKKPAPK